ncbi:MAG TPA: hypothetical protein PLD59_03225 [Tepidisphaeraceae bacterium]|nr:hypothetical protein [Tepidisphaeraceae bacterium]
MALAFVVTLEKEIPELAAYAKLLGGKSLAREADRLDIAARSKGVTAITGLLSESTAALAEQMRAEGFDPSKMRLPPEQWYPAADGIKSVRGIAEYVSAKLNDFRQPNPILRDLKSAEALLVAADAAGVRFHFTRADVAGKK